MPIDTEHLCMGCMNPNTEAVCPNCGYSEDHLNDPEYLQPKTLLVGRYLVGKVFHINGEGACYLAYDMLEQVRVWLYEFVPRGIVIRNEADDRLEHIRGFETQYKTLVADFEALCRHLQRLSATSSGMYPVTDLFKANNTVYCVYQYIRVVDMEALLIHNGGRLTWPQSKKLILSLCNTIAQFHKRGLIHRGISPKTVLIDQNRHIYLAGFSLYSLRTENSVLEPELFSGYAAPEQYAANNWHGTWTDVYAVGALLYRMLTGSDPVDALVRRKGGSLVPPGELVEGVPPNVSDAVMMAMKPDSSARIQTVDAFTVKLLETANSNTAVFDASRMPASRPAAAPTEPTEAFTSAPQETPVEHSVREEKMAELKKYVVLPTLATAVVVLLVVVGVVLFHEHLSGWLGVSQPDSSADDRPVYTIYDDLTPRAVPQFVGRTASSVREDTNLTQQYEFYYVYDFSDEYEAGVIFHQSIPADTPVVNRAIVTLKVSKGPNRILIPTINGLELEDVMRILTALYIEFDVVEQEQAHWADGKVHHSEPPQGTSIDRTSQRITLYVKKESAAASSSRP